MQEASGTRSVLTPGAGTPILPLPRPRGDPGSRGGFGPGSSFRSDFHARPWGWALRLWLVLTPLGGRPCRAQRPRSGLHCGGTRSRDGQGFLGRVWGPGALTRGDGPLLTQSWPGALIPMRGQRSHSISVTHRRVRGHMGSLWGKRGQASSHIWSIWSSSAPSPVTHPGACPVLRAPPIWSSVGSG